MITPPSLPIVIIFDRNWDKYPKQLIKDLIPQLSHEGYDTFCDSAPNTSERKQIASHERGLKKTEEDYANFKSLLKKTNPSLNPEDLSLSQIKQENWEYVVRIKTLPAMRLLSKIYTECQESLVSIQGIDPITEYSTDINVIDREVSKGIDSHIESFTKNLISLHKKGKNIIFECGAVYAQPLLDKMKQNNYDENVLFYIPNTGESFFPNINEIELICRNETLKKQTFSLKNDVDLQALKDKILSDIQNATKDKHYEKTKHPLCDLLADLFNKKCKALVRPGYYVDAFIKDPSKEMTEKLKLMNIEIRTKHFKNKNKRITYLIIPNINTPQVSEKLLWIEKIMKKTWTLDMAKIEEILGTGTFDPSVKE